jgi:hypothetical protein
MSRIALIPLHEDGVPHTVWKALDEVYNFTSDLISIGGLHTKLWAFKVVRVLIFGVLGFLWESLDKMTFGAGPMATHKECYKGEGGGFPQVWAVVNLVTLCLHVARLCTKHAPSLY